MDNISIAENNNLHIPEMPNARVQGDPNVFINSNIVQIGDDVTIQIGATETLPPDSNSYVINTGDNKHVVLKFGLVRGQNGIDGIDGIDGLNGNDGFSPIATVTPTATGATISITDATQTTTANITNGTDGTDGFSPIANVTGTNYGALISITDKDGTTTAQIVDGFSPIATVTPTATGATISITDVNGTTTANIDNGVDGTDGTDGFSPIATVTPTATGATISITDSQGTTTANITNGINGTNGTNGKGYSDYSTSEIATDLKWIDGKTIYQKTITITSLPNATYQDYPHGITFDNVVNYDGIYTDGTTYLQCNTCSTGANNNNAFRTFITANNIRITVGSNRTGWYGYVTIYYTKP